IVELLRVDHTLYTVEVLQVFNQPSRNHLTWREQSDVINIFSCCCANDIFQALCADRILFISQLKKLDLVDCGTRAVRQLLGDISTLEAGDYVKSVWPYYAGNLLN